MRAPFAITGVIASDPAFQPSSIASKGTRLRRACGAAGEQDKVNESFDALTL
jgi:hypothetical protein